MAPTRRGQGLAVPSQCRSRNSRAWALSVCLFSSACNTRLCSRSPQAASSSLQIRGILGGAAACSRPLQVRRVQALRSAAFASMCKSRSRATSANSRAVIASGVPWKYKPSSTRRQVAQAVTGVVAAHQFRQFRQSGLSHPATRRLLPPSAAPTGAVATSRRLRTADVAIRYPWGELAVTGHPPVHLQFIAKRDHPAVTILYSARPCCGIFIRPRSGQVSR